MTYYPVIAELNLKSKHLNITLPIRASYIELVKYRCEPTKEEAMLKQVIAYTVDRKEQFTAKHPGLTWKSSQESMYYSVPVELFRDDKMIYCPKCFLHDGTKHLMKRKGHGVIKVWCSTSPEFVRVEEIIAAFFGGNWKEDSLPRGRHRVKPVCFFDNLKKAKEGLNYHNKNPIRMPKGIEVKVTLKKVTLKQLKQCWVEYQKRRFIKRL